MPISVPSRARVTTLIALLCVIWGSTWIVIQDGLNDLPPFTSAAARFLVAALAMTVIALARGDLTVTSMSFGETGGPRVA